MKKTVTMIAASLLLAACNATSNATEKAVTTQNMQNTAWDKEIEPNVENLLRKPEYDM